ncbi:hypothetical protein AAG906_007852 [Vitis piasezkii]
MLSNAGLSKEFWAEVWRMLSSNHAWWQRATHKRRIWTSMNYSCKWVSYYCKRNILSRYILFKERHFHNCTLNLDNTIHKVTQSHFMDQAMNPTAITSYLSGIEQLSGANFKKWKEQIGIVLGCMDLDYALREPTPTKPTSESTNEQKALYEKWERSNRMSLMIMKGSITPAIHGAIRIR